MSDVWQAVTGAGVDVVPVDAMVVELRHGGRAVRVRLHSFPRPLKPSDVLELVDRHRERGLVVVPAATAAVREAVERAGWSWLVATPTGVRGVLRLGGGEVFVGQGQESLGQPVTGRSGPVPWGSLTVVRRLLQGPTATQRMLAAAAGVSQPRVSQTLTALAGEGLVARRDGGWSVGDFDGLLRWWLERYPGPGGIRTHWYGLDPLRDQVLTVIGLLWAGVSRSLEPSREEPAVVSGDVAADLLAPWRVPVRAVVYARAGADLSEVGLTSSGADEATVELILPQDRGVWAGADGGGDAMMRASLSLPLADPLQILWDVRRAPGADSQEAAERLWELLRERHRLLQGGTAS